MGRIAGSLRRLNSVLNEVNEELEVGAAAAGRAGAAS